MANLRGTMPTERRVRLAALAVMLLTGVCIVWLGVRSPPEQQPDEDPTPAATVSPDLLPPTVPTPTGRVGERREPSAAESSAKLAVVTAAPRPRPARPSLTARDLPLAEGAPALPATLAPRAAGECESIEVRGITHSEDADWAFALVAGSDAERADVRRVGDRVGAYRIQQIEWDRVHLAGSGGRCAVRLSRGVREAAEARGLPYTPDTAEREPVWQLSREIANAIEVTSSRVTIERGVVDALFARGQELLAGVSLTPIREGETAVGVTLGVVPEGSLLHYLGFRDGDVLGSVDDTTLTELGDLGRALGAARERGALNLRCRKAGRWLTVSVTIA